MLQIYKNLTPLSSVLLLLVLLTGCKKDDNMLNNDTVIEAEATQDAATSVANALALNNGGTMEILSDMLNSASSSGIPVIPASMEGNTNLNSSVQKSYDSTTGWWTITISRDRASGSGLYHASYQRIIKQQFLNKNGQFQKHFIVSANGSTDTAYTINHEIVSGSGSSVTPRVSHNLTSLSGKWVARNTNSAEITINTISGFPFTKVGADTVTRLNLVRTLNSSLTLNFQNITGPAGIRSNWRQATSGTITGHYSAVVTFTKGTTYKEKNIERDILITLGGDTLTIKVGSDVFKADALTGDLQ